MTTDAHLDASPTGVDRLAMNLVNRQCFGDMLIRSAQSTPDRIAVVDGEATLTYAELERESNDLGHGLVDLVDYQESVAMMLPNMWQFLAVFFACAKSGRIAVPVTLLLSDSEIAYVVQHSGSRVLVTHQELVPRLETILPLVDCVEKIVIVDGDGSVDSIHGVPVLIYDDVAARDRGRLEIYVEDSAILRCLYTSGTTAGPKGVLTSHAAVHIAALSNALGLDHRRWEPSVQAIVLPLFHCGGQDTAAFPTLITGGTVVLHRSFDAAGVLDDIESRGVTHVILLPDMWKRVLEEQRARPRSVASLRLCHYSMAPMPTTRIAELQEAFPKAQVLLGFGQTEFTPPTTFQWPEHVERKSASCGLPMITTEVEIMSETGELVGPGVLGEIVYRGPQAFSGYLRDPDATEASVRGGWFHSGDLGQIDADGVVWFVDRIKDMIKSGGENVSSLEVEAVLLAHPAIDDCAVIGVADAKWGEMVTAFVVFRKGMSLSLDELREHCFASLARFKVPKKLVVLNVLPRTPTGKIRKAELRRGI